VKPSRVVCAAFLAVAGSALAQADHPYNGTWRAELEGAAHGVPLEGTVVIEDEGGTWDILARKGNNPCVGREAPITVQQATADELVFEINRSKALPGCQDGMARLRRTDNNTLEGVFDKGRKVRLVRQ
jgi:hypothetical protein